MSTPYPWSASAPGRTAQERSHHAWRVLPDSSADHTARAATLDALLRGSDAARWQPELASLARETNSELFFSDLLALGAAMETRAMPENIQRVYGYLSANAPESIAAPARLRLEVLQGSAPFAPQLEYGLSQVAGTATSPEFLIGMSVGGIAYRAGRLSGLQALLGIGVRGRPLLALASAAGISAEAGAFLLSSKAIRGLRGTPGESASLARDYASTWLMLGGLRLGGLVAGRYPQLGMIGGLTAVHQAEMAIGLEAPRPWGSLLAQVAGEWLSFQVGGRLAHGLLGPQVSGLERFLETRGEVLAESQRPRFDFLGTIREPIAIGPQVLAMANESDKGGRVYNMNHDGGSRAGDVPPNPRPHTTTRPIDRSATTGIERNKNEFWLGSQIELLEWIRGTRGIVRQRIGENHLTFKLVSSERYDREATVRELSAMSNLAEIPRGRVIRIEFDDGSTAIEYIRLGSRFFEVKPRASGIPPRPTPVPESPRPNSSEDLQRGMLDVQARMTRISTSRMPAAAYAPTLEMPAVGRPSSSVPPPANVAGVEAAPPLVRIAQDSNGLLEAISRSLEPRSAARRHEVFAYFPKNFEPAELTALRHRLFNLPVGRSFTVHEARSLISYLFERDSDVSGVKMRVLAYPTVDPTHTIELDNIGEAMHALLRLRRVVPGDAGRVVIRIPAAAEAAEHAVMFLNILRLEPSILFRQIDLRYLPPRTPGGFGTMFRFTRSELGVWSVAR